MTPSTAHMNWWQPFSLANGDCQRFSCGQQRLYVQRLGQDLRWATRGGQADEPPSSGCVVQPAEAEGLTWQRLATECQEVQLRLVPVFSSLPLVVRSQQPLSLAPRVTVRFYVGVPCWVRLELVGERPLSLAEIPTMELSRTWFGDPTSGEHCLALKSRARRALDEVELRPHRVLLPLEIRNASETIFAFERACLRVQHCGIHSCDDGRLWSGTVRITYRGPDVDNLLEFENHAPVEAPGAALLVPPRQPGGQHGGIFSLAGLRGTLMS